MKKLNIDLETEKYVGTKIAAVYLNLSVASLLKRHYAGKSIPIINIKKYKANGKLMWCIKDIKRVLSKPEQLVSRIVKNGRETKKKILEAALKVAKKVGLHRVTAGRVCEMAQVSYATVYYHYTISILRKEVLKIAKEKNKLSQIL